MATTQLFWKTFTFNLWSTMTFPLWSTFLFDPTNPTSTVNSFFGTQYISTSSCFNGASVFNFATTTSGIDTGVKMILEGIPLSTVRINGKYALQYIASSATTRRPDQLTINGNRFCIARDSNYNYFLTGTFNSDSGNYGQTIFCGIPWMLDDQKHLILKQKTGNIVEYAQVFWNGIPLRVGRIENSWYLLIASQ